MPAVKSQGGKISWINSPKSTNQISFPTGPSVSRSIRIMDAKSANQKKRTTAYPMNGVGMDSQAIALAKEEYSCG